MLSFPNHQYMRKFWVSRGLLANGSAYPLPLSDLAVLCCWWHLWLLNWWSGWVSAVVSVPFLLIWDKGIRTPLQLCTVLLIQPQWQKTSNSWWFVRCWGRRYWLAGNARQWIRICAPSTRLLVFALLRLLCAASIMLLTWYVRIASSCEAM